MCRVMLTSGNVTKKLCKCNCLEAAVEICEVYDYLFPDETGILWGMFVEEVIE